MRYLLAILVLLVCATPAFGELPFGVACMNDEGDDLELWACQEYVKSVVRSDKIKSTDGETAIYILEIVPHQHGSIVSSAVVVDYVNFECKDIVFSVFRGILVMEKSDTTEADLDNYANSMLTLISEWDSTMPKRIGKMCSKNKPVFAKGE